MTMTDLSSKTDAELQVLLEELEYSAMINDIKQHSRKIGINSVYGACGSAYFRYYDVRLASAVSMTGQLAVKWAAKAVNEYLNDLLKTADVHYVAYIDTDSLYISMASLVDVIFPDKASRDNRKITDTIAKIADSKLVPYIQSAYAEMGEYLNVYRQDMDMKREVIADKVLLQAKKRYICNVLNSEGVPYDPPELKIMGIESVRTSTPGLCRGAIKETIRKIMQEDEESAQEYIAAFKKKFFASAPVDIAFPSGCNGLQKYEPTVKNSENQNIEFDKTGRYLKHTPIHVKAALVHNALIAKLGIESDTPFIREGSKIKYVYLKQPNPLQETVIAFDNFIPDAFGISAYIDVETQYQKTFLNPVEKLLEIIDWNATETISLEDFFS